MLVLQDDEFYVSYALNRQWNYKELVKALDLNCIPCDTENLRFIYRDKLKELIENKQRKIDGAERRDKSNISEKTISNYKSLIKWAQKELERL